MTGRGLAWRDVIYGEARITGRRSIGASHTHARAVFACRPWEVTVFVTGAAGVVSPIVGFATGRALWFPAVGVFLAGILLVAYALRCMANDTGRGRR